MEEKLSIFTIIVCYNPDINNVSYLCQVLLASNSAVVVIDNTENSYLSKLTSKYDCTLIEMKENSGVAHAQNVGIKHALECGADFIVFFDQDSKVELGFLTKLIAPLRVGRCGVVSPVCIDESNEQEYPSHSLGMFGLPIDIYTDNRSHPYFTDIVISSGLATTATTFDKVGIMDEDFFIDFVDIEWCLRCRNNNVPILVVPNAIMKHSIGDRTVKLSIFRGVVHSPTRSYYKIRNCFLLFRKSHIPILFSIRQLLSGLVHNLLLILFVNNKLDYLNNYVIAVTHGILGVSGKKTNL